MIEEKHRRVIQAATQVFLRYGFRRTTMGDLAKAAGLSRPGLYLLYCNKERIFEAALGSLAAATLEEVRAAVTAPERPLARLRAAFELWAVRPFELLQGSPDARDLVPGDLAFAEGLKAQWQAAFEAMLVPVLAAFPGAGRPEAPGLEQIAHVLAASVHGFKHSARSAGELREMIESLLQLTAASLEPAGGR